jgi:hypothetical protein
MVADSHPITHPANTIMNLCRVALSAPNEMPAKMPAQTMAQPML